MRTLNKNKRYGTIHGATTEYPNARYEQDGALFDAHGQCLFVTAGGEMVPYVAKVHDADAAKQAAPSKTADEDLDDQASVITVLERKVAALEAALEKAKAGDIQNKDYTQNCADAQKALTNAKRELTKAVNKAAAIEQAGAK